MKSYFLSLFFALSIGSGMAFAQTSKGTVMYGGLIHASFMDYNEENVIMGDISPNLLVFIENSLAVGGSVELGVMRFTSGRYNSLGIFPTARYYFGKPKQPARVFLLGDFGYHLTSYTKIAGGTAKAGLGLGAGPGFTYFVSPQVSFESMIKTRFLRYSDTSTGIHYQIKMGIQLYMKPQKR